MGMRSPLVPLVKRLKTFVTNQKGLELEVYLPKFIITYKILTEESPLVIGTLSGSNNVLSRQTIKSTDTS